MGESGSSAASVVSACLESSLVDGRDNVILHTIMFEGVLSEFGKGNVRLAFLRGLLGATEDLDAKLKSVDRIREVMLPGLTHRGAVSRDEAALFGQRFFSALLSESKEEPTDLEGNFLPYRCTYERWYKFFESISTSAYWRAPDVKGTSVESKATSPAQNQSCEELPLAFQKLACRSSPNDDLRVRGVLGSDAPDLGNSFSAGPLPAAHVRSAVEVESDTRGRRSALDSFIGAAEKKPKLERDRTAAPLHGPRRRGRRSQISDSDSEDSSSSLESDVSSEISDYRRGGGSRQRSRRREVVPPSRFDGESRVSMKRYLSEFDEYFFAKYDGTSRQQAKLLGEFLTGRAREAYEALDGSQLRYSSLKRKLLQWHSGERVSSRRRAESEFESAFIGSTESLSIFALRLERLAEVAFPESTRERNRHLCRKFWTFTPESFVRVMLDSQRTIELSSGKKQLPWSVMKRLAEAEGRSQRTMPVRRQVDDFDCATGVWYSRPETRSGRGRAWQNNASDETSSQRARVTFDNRASSGRGERRSSPGLICNWCGRRGHREANCWERARLCVYCGSDEHESQACRRLDGNHQTFSPSCPECEGEHLGKFCPQLEASN